jgi:hypothetical protein
MPVNDKQKLILIDINANTQQLIQDKLNQGFVIEYIVSLLPTFTKLLIVYATPEVI